MGVSAEAAQRGHKAAWAAARSNPEVTDYWQRAFEVAGVPAAERTAARASQCEAALARALARPYRASLDAARRAKAAGVIIGIISNHLVSPNLFEYCAEGACLRDLVTDPSLLVVSQAVGCGKPHADIYNLFFRRLRAIDPTVTAGELRLFVDDKPKNVEAARALGWQGIVHDAKRARPGELAEGLAAHRLPLADHGAEKTSRPWLRAAATVTACVTVITVVTLVARSKRAR